MASFDLRTASPAEIREFVGVQCSFSEAQEALAARRLPPLFVAGDVEIKKAFAAERLPIGLALGWIVYRDHRMAYIAAIALHETRQAIASPSLTTATDMMVPWSVAINALWDRLHANDGVVAFDGDLPDLIIPANEWPRLRFMVCKGMNEHGKSARSLGHPHSVYASFPPHEGCGTDRAYEDVWVSRADVLREWPKSGDHAAEPVDASVPSDTEMELAAIKKSRREGGVKTGQTKKDLSDLWKSHALKIVLDRGNKFKHDKYGDLFSWVRDHWEDSFGPTPPPSGFNRWLTELTNEGKLARRKRGY